MENSPDGKKEGSKLDKLLAVVVSTSILKGFGRRESGADINDRSGCKASLRGANIPPSSSFFIISYCSIPTGGGGRRVVLGGVGGGGVGLCVIGIGLAGTFEMNLSTLALNCKDLSTVLSTPDVDGC